MGLLGPTECQVNTNVTVFRESQQRNSLFLDQPQLVDVFSISPLPKVCFGFLCYASCSYFRLTRTVFLVRGERYISIHYTCSPHEKLGRVVISASPWPILFYGVVARKNWLLFYCNFELLMNLKKGLPIISHCVVQLFMYFILLSLHQARGSGQRSWLISEPCAALHL